MQMWGMLVEMRIDTISGFDLSALNAFRWHPHHEKVNLSRQGNVSTCSPSPLRFVGLLC